MCGKSKSRYDLNDPRQRAQKQVDEKKGFYKHLTVYVAINGFFILSSLFAGRFPHISGMTFFWGIGLAVHYVNVFGLNFLHGSDWEDREIERELRKMGYEERDGEMHKVDIDERLQKRDSARRYDESELI